MGVVPAIRRFGRRCLTTVGRSRFGERALAIVMSDREVLRATLNRLSDEIAASASIDAALPSDLHRIDGFEDCVWLLSSNVVNHSAARLMLSEAAHLFATVRRFEGTPRVVEIGRYRGGTAFLLAAAGANVLSIDVDEQLRVSDASLHSALARVALDGNVEAVFGDSATFPIEAGSIDLVFVDGDHTYSGVSRDVAHWVPALRSGGILLLHDAKWPEPSHSWNRPPDRAVLGVHRLVRELRQRSDLKEMSAPGTLVQFRLEGN